MTTKLAWLTVHSQQQQYYVSHVHNTAYILYLSQKTKVDAELFA